MLSQCRTEIRAVPSGEQQFSFRHLRILISDHLEFNIGSDAIERNGRVFAEVRRTQAAKFFAAIADEVDRSLGLRNQPRVREQVLRLRSCRRRRHSRRYTASRHSPVRRCRDDRDARKEE